MNKVKLQEEKKQLEVQREQAIATINQITGAIAMVDKMLEDIDTEDVETSKDSEVKKK